MKKKVIAFCMSTIMFLANASPIGAVIARAETGKASGGQAKFMRVMDKMPDIIPGELYKYKDYGQTAIDMNDVLFDFADKEKGTPTYYGGFIDVNGKESFGLDAYVRNEEKVQTKAGEAVAQMPAVLSALLMGVDKTNEKRATGTYDFVEMLDVFYNEQYGMVLNNEGGKPDSEFWYMLYPQTVYARIYDQVKDKAGYRHADVMKNNIIKMADNYVNALPYFVDEDGKPNFDYTRFDFTNMKPEVSGQTEAPNHAIAFMLYAAYQETGEQKYLNAMKEYMDWIDKSNKNPNYEIMTDYGPAMTAIMNFKYGTSYDVEKAMNWLFDGDSDSRGSWGVITGTWNGYPSDGLVGSISDHGGYGFNMNTMHTSGALATTAKYDPRFSTNIGKWFLNASNSSRMYYPLEMPAELQASSYMTSEKLSPLLNKNGRSFVSDPKGAIGYEGVMNMFEANGKSPFAISDSWRAGLQGGHGGSIENNTLTDFSIYGSANVGIMGATIKETNVSQILQIDLNKNDAFMEKDSYPQFLYYNPYNEIKNVKTDFVVGSSLFDVNTKKIIAENIGKDQSINIPAEDSLNIIVLPKGAKVKHEGQFYMVGNKLIAKDTVSVSILNPDKQRLSVADEVSFDFAVSKDEPIKSMKFTATSLVDESTEILYEGASIDKYKINTNSLPNGLVNFIVSVETMSGLKDQSSIKLNIYNKRDGNIDDVAVSWTAEEMVAQFEPHLADSPGAVELGEDGWARITIGESKSGWGSIVKTPSFTVDFDKNPVIEFVIQNPTNAWCLKFLDAELDINPSYYGEYILRDTNAVGFFSLPINKILKADAPKGIKDIKLSLYDIGNTPDTSFEIKDLRVVYKPKIGLEDINYNKEDIIKEYKPFANEPAKIEEIGTMAVVPYNSDYAEVKSQEIEIDFSKNPIGFADITKLNGKYAIRFDIEGIANEIYTYYDRSQNYQTGAIEFNILECIGGRDYSLIEKINEKQQPLKARMTILVEGEKKESYVAVGHMGIKYEAEDEPIFYVDEEEFTKTFSGGNAKFDMVDKTSKVVADDGKNGAIMIENINLDLDKDISVSVFVKNVRDKWSVVLVTEDGEKIDIFKDIETEGDFYLMNLRNLLLENGYNNLKKQKCTLLLYVSGEEKAEGEFEVINFIYDENIIPRYNLKLDYNIKTASANDKFNLKATMDMESDLSWSSSDINVATVDNNGRVTVLKSGVAIITASTADGLGRQECIVYVLPSINDEPKETEKPIEPKETEKPVEPKETEKPSSPSGNSVTVSKTKGLENTKNIIINGKEISSKVNTDGMIEIIYDKSETEKLISLNKSINLDIKGDENISITLTGIEKLTNGIQININEKSIAIPTIVINEFKSDESKITINIKSEKTTGQFSLSIFRDGKKISIPGAKNPIKITMPYEKIADENGANIIAICNDGLNNYVIKESIYIGDKIIFMAPLNASFSIKDNNKKLDDVKNHWSENYMKFVSARDIMVGVGNDIFSPDTNMTRAMFVATLANLENITTSDHKKIKYNDVDEQAWFATYITWATDIGLVSGVGNGNFNPDEPITREQMAVILNKYIEYKGYKLKEIAEPKVFIDIDNISDWAKKSVDNLQKYGLVNGKNNNAYDPSGLATRAEVATIVNKLIEKLFV